MRRWVLLLVSAMLLLVPVGSEVKLAHAGAVSISSLTAYPEDTDNIYAQKKFYEIDVLVEDADGGADLEWVYISLMRGGVTVATFEWTPGGSFDEVNAAWDMNEAACTADVDGDELDLAFYITPEWNAVEEADLDIYLYARDGAMNQDDATYNVNLDVVTNLVSTISLSDDRGDLSEVLVADGVVRYANDPASATATTYYPPNAEFNTVSIYNSTNANKGTDLAIANGVWSITFYADATVGLDTYNPYIDMADASYTDGEETTTDTFIADTIYLLTLTQTQANPVGSTSVVYTATANLTYAAHLLGSGDSFTLDGVVFAWDDATSTFKGAKTMVGPFTFDMNSIDACSEVTYGITQGNMGGLSLQTVWSADPGGGGGGGGPPPDVPGWVPAPVEEIIVKVYPWWQRYGVAVIVGCVILVFLLYGGGGPKRRRRGNPMDSVLNPDKFFQVMK